MNSEIEYEAQPSDELQAVLAGLRGVEVPEGLEERVMLRVSGARARMTQPRQRPQWIASNLRHGWFVSASAMALLLIGVMALGHEAAIRSHRTGSTAAMSSSATAVVSSTQAVAEQKAARRVDAAGRVDAVRPVLLRRTLAQRRPPARLQSFPAPPLPLTDQERLLLKLVRRDAPTQLAKTDEVARAESDAEFERFFRPPPPPKPTKQAEVAPIVTEPTQAEITREPQPSTPAEQGLLPIKSQP